MNSYKDLEIYNLAYALALQVHHLTLELPKHELYEQGSQLRRSSKRIKDTIAEGFGRRRYKVEFVRYLIFAHASCDEAISQIEMISELYYKEKPLTQLIEEYNILGRKINKFIQYVEKNWKT
jgi:four helix bundle protein